MADGSGGIMECFTLSGLIKILESCAAFTCVMLHRIGDQGNEVKYVLPKYSISYPTYYYYFLDGNLNSNHPCISYRLFSLRLTRSYTRKMLPMRLKLMPKSLALGQSLPSLSSARCSCWLMLFMDGKQFKERT